MIANEHKSPKKNPNNDMSKKNEGQLANEGDRPSARQKKDKRLNGSTTEFQEELDVYERQLNSEWIEKKQKEIGNTNDLVERACMNDVEKNERIKQESIDAKESLPAEIEDAEGMPTQDLRVALKGVAILAETITKEQDIIKIMDDRYEYYLNCTKGILFKNEKANPDFNTKMDISNLEEFSENGRTIQLIDSENPKSIFGGNAKKKKTYIEPIKKKPKVTLASLVTDFLTGNKTVFDKKHEFKAAAIKIINQTPEQMEKLRIEHEKRRDEYEEKKLERGWAKMNVEQRKDVKKQLIQADMAEQHENNIEQFVDKMRKEFDITEDNTIKFEAFQDIDTLDKRTAEEKDALQKQLIKRDKKGLINTWGYTNSNLDIKSEDSKVLEDSAGSNEGNAQDSIENTDGLNSTGTITKKNLNKQNNKRITEQNKEFANKQKKNKERAKEETKRRQEDNKIYRQKMDEAKSKKKNKEQELKDLASKFFFN